MLSFLQLRIAFGSKPIVSGADLSRTCALPWILGNAFALNIDSIEAAKVKTRSHCILQTMAGTPHTQNFVFTHELLHHHNDHTPDHETTVYVHHILDYILPVIYTCYSPESLTPWFTNPTASRYRTLERHCMQKCEHSIHDK
jgi:hypothetical protein